MREKNCRSKEEEARWKELFLVEREVLTKARLSEVKELAALEFERAEKRKRQSFGVFLLKQFRFLAWKIWFCQGMVLAGLCAFLFRIFENCSGSFLERNLPAALCACSSVVVLCAFPMLERAQRCRMLETEQAAYFSGTGRMAAQLMFIGAGDAGMLAVLAALALRLKMPGNLLFISLVIPFLTAASSLLMLWQRLGTALFWTVSVPGCLLPAGMTAWLIRTRTYEEIASRGWMWGWACVSAGCILLLGLQYRKILRQNIFISGKEYLWN